MEENKSQEFEENLEEHDVEGEVQDETEQLEEELEVVDEYKEKYEDLQGKFVRLQADFANFKRRSNEERSSFVGLGVEKLAIGILPVLDNFDRAMEMVEDKSSPFFEGMEMLQRQFVEILNNNEIREIDAINQPFDPNFHHAVLMESLEGVEAGLVTTVLQKGYLHGDKVIRPAMVKVSE